MERERAKTFQDLVVWQKAHEFVLSVYSLSRSFPKEEIYGLTSQFRRAAVSIPANIAEGFKKSGKPDKCRFMNIAQGDSQVLLDFGKRYRLWRYVNSCVSN